MSDGHTSHHEACGEGAPQSLRRISLFPEAVLKKQWCRRGASREGPRTETSNGSYLTDWSGHGNSTLLFLGVLHGQVRLLRVRTPGTNPPWHEGI